MLQPLSVLRVVPSFRDKRKGRIFIGQASFPCALGRSGAGLKKREGDGITPKGVWRLGRLHMRADRVRLGRKAGRRIKRTDWWSDDPSDRSYNRLVVSRPMPKGSKEGLWREDRLYDIVIEIGYNDRPVRRHRGSGIFLHLAREGYLPTEGCVAVSLKTMRHILARIGPGTRVWIG